MLGFPLDSPMPGGYFHFGNNHVLIQFSSFEDILQMLIDCWNSHPEKPTHRLLCTPNRLILDDNLHLALLFRKIV